MKHFLFKRTGFIMLFLGFLLCSMQSWSQYTATNLETGNYIAAIAKDNSNNIYVTRYNNTNHYFELVKYMNGTGTPTVIYSNISNNISELPWGLAVNALGDVFVTNVISQSQIIKLTAPSYTPSVVQSGNYYTALAVDNSNNLLAMEYNSGTNTYQLVRYPFGAESLPGAVVYNGLSIPTAPDDSRPWCIVTDQSNNIYITDYHTHNGGQLIKLTAPTFTPSILATNKAYTALTKDDANNFYTIEQDPAGLNVARVMKYTDPAAPGTQLYTGLKSAAFARPWGLAATSNGTVYAGEYDDVSGNGGRLVKLSPPAITVSSVNRASANPTNATSVNYTVTFAASAANVTTSSFSLTTTGLTGASIASVSGSGTTYTVAVNTGTGTTGTLRLDVNGTGISPAVTNIPFTTGQTYTIDRVAPTGSISINAGATYTNNTGVTLTLTGTDASTPLEMAFSLDGGAYTAYEAFAATKALTLPTTDGTRSVTVRLKDAAGNTTTYSDDIILDRAEPNTNLLTTPVNPTTSSVATFTFDATETGCTFEASLDGGAYSPVTSPATISGLADGSHTFNVRAKDAAGNVDGTPAGYTWTVDAATPTITSVNVPANGYYKAGQTLTFTVLFSENVTVTGTPYLPLTIGSSIVQANYVSGSGTGALTFAYTVQAGENDMDGIQAGTALQLNGGTIKDVINNAVLTLNNVAPTSLVRVNTVIPSVTLSTASTLSNVPYNITVTFSEAVSGLTVADFNIIGATVSNLTTTDNITWTVRITPAAEGLYNLSLPANTVTNIGGNANTASNTLVLFYDINTPDITSVTVPNNGYYKAGDILRFTVNTNELIRIVGTPRLMFTIGAKTVFANFTGGDVISSLQFEYTVEQGEMDMDGITVNALQLNGGTMQDLAGNNMVLTLNGVGNTTLVRVNTTHPTVAISSNATNPVTGPFTLTVTFSEAVTGFTSAGINVSNATLSAVLTADNITYTALVTPTGGGNISIDVPANVAENIGHNGNSASNTLSLIYDLTPPAITSVSVPVNGYYKAGDVLSFAVNFDENVVVTGTPSLPVTIGTTTVLATYTGGTGTNTLTFAYTVQPGNNDADGIALGTSLQLNGGTIKDAAANNANLTLNSVGNTNGVFVNTVIPTVVVGGAISLNTPSTVSFVFSEPVSGFTAADITLTNATASNLQTTDNITYTVLITPVADGTVSISIPANVAVNIGGNGNSASAPLSYLYDATPPVITLVSVPLNGYYRAGDLLDFRVNFSENVQVSGATPSLPVIIGSTTVQAAYVGGSNTNTLVFSYTVQDGDHDMDGITIGAGIQLNGAIVRDLSANNANVTLQNVGNTTGVFVNTTHPTVTLSASATRTNGAFTLTTTFSEAVSSLSINDYIYTNSAFNISLSTTDNITWTVIVIPLADGPMTIQLPADAALNIGNNGNRASNTVTVIADLTAPVITAAQNFNILQNSTAGTTIGQALATDASGIIQNWAIANDPTGGAFAISATGMISVNNMALLNNNVGSTINLQLTVTDGLNTSSATAVAIKIDAINKAPILDAINNVTLCATTNSQTIQLTGASAVEPTQTYTLSIASNQANFDVLTVSAAGLITYQLKPSVTSGVATITVTIKDNGGTANGGVDTYQRSFTITVNPLPVVTITSDKGNSVSKGEVVYLTATGGASYSWTATNSNILSGQQAAIAEVRPQANTTYQVAVTNNAGCNNTASFSIATIEDFKVDATNVLTPNGDGKNDRWVIRNIDSYLDNELKIFDRSGRLVFSQRNYNNTWDGKVNGHPLAEGTYYYFLSISGGAKTAKGYITIILKAN